MMDGNIAFVVILSLLIFVHELGHFLTAKLSGVRVEEFGFGYPPRMIKLGTWQGTILSLNWLPIGGFTRMGEDNPEQLDGLANKGRGTRALVFTAGSLMNLALALLINITVPLFGVWDQSGQPGAGIYSVARQSPAAVAGLRPGDNIVRLDGQVVPNVEDAMQRIRAKVGQPVEVVVNREGRELPPVALTPRTDPPPREGAVGVSLGPSVAKRSVSLWEAARLGVRTTWESALTLGRAVAGMVRREVPVQLSGPVGVYMVVQEVAKDGLLSLLSLTAFLSINLFVVNLLPLPALDGGRLVFVFLEWVRRGRRIAPEKEGWVHAVGMVGLIVLVVVLSYFDLMRGGV
jgi:regulator of sigma E protease